MQLVLRESTDPYFNIAAEEYLIKNTSEPIFMIWQNQPSVIVGKHQNPLKEVNLDFVNQHQIPVIRRISGGGTVYHDLGNINYSFIDFGKAESLVNFAKYSKPILELLQKMGVNAELVGKSDLKIEGKKFSGNASHVYKNRVLHHGTLLYKSDLNILNESIRIKGHQITDKAVNSNRSVVTNISDHLHQEMHIDTFKQKLINYIKSEFPEIHETQLNSFQEGEIQRLVEEKYQNWEWNFGYSPKYSISGTIKQNDSKTKINIHFHKGLIKEIESDYKIPDIEQLIGLQHEEETLNSAMKLIMPDSIRKEFLNIFF